MPIRLLVPLLLTAVHALTGCTSTSQGPAVLRLESAAYRTTFEAATEAVRHEGLQPELRDLRGGVIETAEAPVPSLLEPWRDDGAGLERRWEATLGRERRRARIAFSPAEAVESDPQADGAALLSPTEVDLTAGTGALEMRIWVYIERAHRPGVRRSLWSRRITSRSVIVPPEGVAPLPTATWTPIARDHDFERRLLARIEDSLPKAP